MCLLPLASGNMNQFSEIKLDFSPSGQKLKVVGQVLMVVNLLLLILGFSQFSTSQFAANMIFGNIMDCLFLTCIVCLCPNPCCAVIMCMFNGFFTLSTFYQLGNIIASQMQAYQDNYDHQNYAIVIYGLIEFALFSFMFFQGFALFREVNALMAEKNNGGVQRSGNAGANRQNPNPYSQVSNNNSVNMLNSNNNVPQAEPRQVPIVRGAGNQLGGGIDRSAARKQQLDKLKNIVNK